MDRRRFLLASGATVLAACAADGGHDQTADATGPSEDEAGPSDDATTEPTPATDEPTTAPTTQPTTPAPSTAAPSTEPPTTGAPTTTAPPTTARFMVSGPAVDQVALTFHVNGDLGLVDRLLALLADRHAPITAFVVGNWLDANPDQAARLVDGGHEIANHTWTHPTLARLGAAAVADEIGRCRDVLDRLTGGGGRWFRPSGTTDGTATPNGTILDESARAGYGWVSGYDVDPRDYEDPGADLVVQRTLSAVRPGSVVSLHAGHAGTITALPRILDGLDTRGLRPVRLSDLIPA